MDVSQDRCGSDVEKTWASGERSASKGACYVRRGGVGVPERLGPGLLPYVAGVTTCQEGWENQS